MMGIGIFLLWLIWITFTGGRKLVEWDMTPCGYDNILRFEYDDGTVEEYKGNCTVWHKQDKSGVWRRCDTFTESWLSDYWTTAKYNK